MTWTTIRLIPNWCTTDNGNDMKPLDEKAIKGHLSDTLSQWEWADGKLHRSFRFSNFRKALIFITELGFIAEAQGHHPELHNIYNRVNISLTTHDADNRVTEKDIALAKAIEEIYRND